MVIASKGEITTEYGVASNSSHFTGKKKVHKSSKKRVVRPKQEPHKKNKYSKFSNVGS